MKGIRYIMVLFSMITLIATCKSVSSNKQMISLLDDLDRQEMDKMNPFATKDRIDFYDSLYRTAANLNDSNFAQYVIASTWLEAGEELKSISTYENLLLSTPDSAKEERRKVLKDMGITYMRIGERMNCLNNHAAESCIFPIAGRGIHQNKQGSEQAITIFTDLLKQYPGDLESRWLLNVAYMTTGGYPSKVPKEFLLEGLDKDASNVKPFVDVAIKIGLNTKNLAGGSIIDDFNNDGNLDLITSSWSLKEGMHYCMNNGTGAFTDLSDSSGLKYLKGGLNIMQTDYNNDGFKDIFVTRGAWKGKFGNEPKSLLKNNGDGTFTDVTEEAGLLSFYPTQAATWADFNNDGWLDVYIGSEAVINEVYKSNQLFINNKNGTFTDVTTKSGSDMYYFVKGVTSGDYDNDGLVDIFVSTLNGDKILLKNTGIRNGIPIFQNVSQRAGLNLNKTSSFATWFWDYDNDGWLDILVCGYDFKASLAVYAAAEALHLPVKNGATILYHNNHDGTFTDLSIQLGLQKTVFAMGANFGDFDNDGWLDMYFGTGNPKYTSLVPNKFFRNNQGMSFTDITIGSRTGNLQKGHAVSFADMDNDGDNDIYIEMGGAYEGDAYQNSLYLNPGQNNNHWIKLSLEGVKANKAAIGARLKINFTDNGIKRSVYRDVNSGGSFGSNPLMQHIGLGKANQIESIEIKWPGSNTKQVLKNIPADQFLKIKEGVDDYSVVKLNMLDFTLQRPLIGCSPH